MAVEYALRCASSGEYPSIIFESYALLYIFCGEGNFDENLKSYLDEHPKYLQKETKDDEPQSTGASVKKISNHADDGVTAILKAKHPDINF